jgi:hypothetical protein
MLHLDRLSREQTGHIISEVSGGKQLPREVQEQIMSKADGVRANSCNCFPRIRHSIMRRSN